MPQPHSSGTSSELKLLRSLIDRSDGATPSKLDAEKGLESGVARVMLLEGRLREQASRPSGMRPREGPCEEHDLVEEIRALREAVAELRAGMNPGESAPLAKGFVLRRNR